MGTLWIVCAEATHETTSLGWELQQLQQRQQQQRHRGISGNSDCASSNNISIVNNNNNNSNSNNSNNNNNNDNSPSNYLEATTRRTRTKPLHDENGRWVCDVCGKIYNRGDSLAHHRSIHRGDTICPICQAVFTRKYTMRCHMVNVHGIKIKA